MSVAAALPPLGWNSWNQWQGQVDQQKVLAAAQALRRLGLQAMGYDTVVIDDCWSEPDRDAHGDLVARKDRFPDGVPALAEALHGMGLKLGIYSCAAEKTCAGFLGSLGHEDADAALFARWGIDFLKYDYCNAPTDQASAIERYTRMGQALQRSGRPILYSICEWGGREPQRWARRAGGHLWRVSADLFDNWKDVWVESPGYFGAGVGSAFDLAAALAPYGGPGGWNDLDMLILGLKGKGAVPGSGLSQTEYRCHLTLWILACSPLMLGCDLDALGAEELAWLLNPEPLAVNQDPLGVPARRALVQGSCEAWLKPLADGGSALGLFNRGDAAAELVVQASALGLQGVDKPLRDLWARQDLGPFGARRAWALQPHEGLLLKLA